MSGILPFADVYHPIWSPVANKIHAAIWDHVGLEVVQGFVQEWASKWVNDFNTPDPAQQESLARVRQELHYPDDETLPLLADNLPDDWQLKEALWQPKLPALPLPPSHSSCSLPEKWAGLAAVHDVFDLTGDKVLPWSPPEDDHDIIAFTEWNRGEGGAYQELLRKVSKLPETKTYVVPIRRWLTDVSRDTPPKVTKPNVLPKVVEWAKDSEESSNAIEVPQGPSLREILTAGLSDREMNMLAKLIEIEQQYSEQPAGKENPCWKKRYQANRYQKQQAAKGKRNLALTARRIFEAERDRMQNLNVQ